CTLDVVASPIGSRYLRQKLRSIMAPRKPGRGSNSYRIPGLPRNSRDVVPLIRAPKSGRLLPISLQPAVDQSDCLIDRSQAHAFLRSDGLHQAVSALDVGRAVRQSPRGGGWGQERERRAGVLLEGHQVLLVRT